MLKRLHAVPRPELHAAMCPQKCGDEDEDEDDNEDEDENDHANEDEHASVTVS